MRRRKFLELVGGAMVAAWPLVARGQQQRVYRIGFSVQVPPQLLLLA
jgi:hypothetical protein